MNQFCYKIRSEFWEAKLLLDGNHEDITLNRIISMFKKKYTHCRYVFSKEGKGVVSGSINQST